MSGLDELRFCVGDLDCKLDKDEAFVEKNSFGIPYQELGLFGQVLVLLQKGLEWDVQEKADLPEKHPVSCLLEVDHVALVLPDAGHLLVGAMPLQKSLHPPSHVIEENQVKKYKADPDENLLVTLNVIPIVNLMVFIAGMNMIQEKTKSPALAARRKCAPDTNCIIQYTSKIR